jgi:hypothetical protein
MKNHPCSRFTALFLCFGLFSSLAFSQQVAEKIYGKEHPFTIQELPAGKLKTKLETLAPESQEKAMRWMHKLTFKEFDAAEHMRVDNDGGIFTICPDGHGNCDGHSHETEIVVESQPSAETPGTGNAPVPISAPPVYNSRPAAQFHLYLDFNGAVVSGKAWNSSYSVTSWDCSPWGADGDNTTFSDSEQAAMKEIWQRMAEDYAPFDINVTTDVRYDPVNNINLVERNKVAWLLFTPTSDKNGKACPHAGSGGVAYVGVFDHPSYHTLYQPAWVTPSSNAYMSEAGSHEIGHNLGLSHDGTTTAGYYAGHGNDDISWNPIMGAALRNVSTWSKGQYYKANQFQDDLTIMSDQLAYVDDDHYGTAPLATALVIPDGVTISSTTPANDPDNDNPENKGVISTALDVDVFSFQTGPGPITLNVNPVKQSSGTNGNNLDISIQLRNSLGVTVATSNPETNTFASITTTVPAGVYYLYVDNSAAGSPMLATPTGYTDYGSLGQYFISGTIVEATPMLRVLSITPNVGDVDTSVSVTITGTLFAATPTVKLTKTGYSDIVATNVVFVNSETLTCDFNLTGVALGEWNVVVTNPDLETATLPGAFTVELPEVDFYEEFFDASLSLPTGWSTYSTTEATPLWGVVSTSSQTINNSVFAGCPSVISTKYIESPSIPIPLNAVNLKFSFWQDCDMETGYDGGTLQFKIDDGDWFDVTSNESGAGFESNGYNQIISSAYRSPIAGQYAWSGKSNGYIQSVIAISDPTKYSGKTLKARWLLASDNFAVSKGWNIDTVEITGSIYVEPGDPDVNYLEVTTEDDLTFVGTHGGPFTPTPQTYTLTNSGPTSLKWTAAKGTSWVTLSASSGNLEAGKSVTLSVLINSNALALPVGTDADTINIINLSKPDDVITRGVSIEVNSIPVTVTITGRNHNYNGSPKSVTVTTDPTGIPVIVTYNGNTTPPTNPGTYAVVATVNKAFHAGSATANMTIYPVPNLVRTTVNNVTSTGWTTVNFGKTYVSPVIIATPIYRTSSLPPVVTRIRNVTPTSFQLRLARADGLSTAVSMSVSVVAVNEGVYTVAQQGVKMEAVKYTSTLTASGTSAWNAEARTYENTYTNPVVVGQVMSFNDSRWSAFWSRGALATDPISAASLNVGKHVGLDTVKTRANETIGYIVIESGTGTINGVRYQAAVGTDIVRCFGDAVTPYAYPLSGFTSVSTAAVSQTGMDGTEGSWAVLSGAPAFTTTTLKLHVAEDGFNNTLRKHTTEQVAFIVFQ